MEGIDPKMEDAVKARIEACLAHIRAPDGGVRTYEVVDDRLELTDVEDLDEGGPYRWHFRALVQRAGERPEPVQGRITLDTHHDFVFDDDGNLAFSPWDCLHPDRWDRPKEAGAGGADRPAPDDREEVVFERVRACLSRIVDPAQGRIRGWDLDPDSFEIVGRSAIDEDRTAYRFTVRYGLESGDPRTRGLEGEIVLDADDRLTFDDRGRVRIDQGEVLHPRFWSDPPDWVPRDGPWDDPLAGALSRMIPAEVESGTNPLLWRPGTDLVDTVSERLEEMGRVLVLPDPDVEPRPPQATFEEAMKAIARRSEVETDLVVMDGPEAFDHADAVPWPYHAVFTEGPPLWEDWEDV